MRVLYLSSNCNQAKERPRVVCIVGSICGGIHVAARKGSVITIYGIGIAEVWGYYIMVAANEILSHLSLVFPATLHLWTSFMTI